MMGQSIRTSKSARPGTIIYVPLDKSEFRSTVSSDKKKNKIMKIVVMLIVMILVMSCCVYAGISYYYSYHFFLGTTINGIDSSNKTASCPFFSRAKYRAFPSGVAQTYAWQLFPFSLAFVQSVCITGESSISA